MKPTMQLRWIETYSESQPTATMPAWPETVPYRFILQQYWQSETDDDIGEWRDIEVVRR